MSALQILLPPKQRSQFLLRNFSEHMSTYMHALDPLKNPNIHHLKPQTMYHLIRSLQRAAFYTINSRGQITHPKCYYPIFLFSHKVKVLCKTHIMKNEKKQLLIDSRLFCFFSKPFQGEAFCFTHLRVTLFTMTTQTEKVKSTARDWISSFDYVIPGLQIKHEKSIHGTERSTLTLKVYIWSN